MLRAALNAVTKIHSRPAVLKRLGAVDMYSPMRFTPSNYFRFLRGPEYTSIKGVEGIIPVDSLRGEFAQRLTFATVPTSGQFRIQIGVLQTALINFNASAATIQTEVRLLTGFSQTKVTGSFSSGFLFTFSGISTQPPLATIVNSTLDHSGTFSNTYVPWADKIKKGDRILDGNRLLVVDEIMEMPDLGGQTMAYRVRCD